MTKPTSNSNPDEVRIKINEAQAVILVARHYGKAWIWSSFWLGFFGLASSIVWVCGR